MCILFWSPLHRTTHRFTQYRQSDPRIWSTCQHSYSAINPYSPSQQPGALTRNQLRPGYWCIAHRHATRPTSLTPGHRPPLRQEGLQSVLCGPPGCQSWQPPTTYPAPANGEHPGASQSRTPLGSTILPRLPLPLARIPKLRPAALHVNGFPRTPYPPRHIARHGDWHSSPPSSPWLSTGLRARLFSTSLLTTLTVATWPSRGPTPDEILVSSSQNYSSAIWTTCMPRGHGWLTQSDIWDGASERLRPN